MRWQERRRLRVYAVVDLRRGRVHGLTCDINEQQRWCQEIEAKYGGDRLSVITCVGLVDPDDAAIPLAVEGGEP